MAPSPKEQQQQITEAFQNAKSDAERIWKLVSEETKEPDPLFTYKGNPVIFKNTIVLVQGKSGVHKSRLTSSLASLLVTEESSKELLGFQNTCDDEIMLIYCDTERNITYQLPDVIKQIISDADTDIETLRSKFAILPLMNIHRSKRTNVMGEQFKELRKNDKIGNRHFVLVLDIISDLVGGFNDVEETMGLIDLINNAINTLDITFIVVIHENPGSVDKARGHLGTELSNKASTIFQISETTMDKVFKLKMLKSRSTQKYDELLLKFDPAVNNLVAVTDQPTCFELSDPEIFRLCSILADNFFTTMGRVELLHYLESRLGWKERKIEEKLKKMIDNQIEIPTALGNTILTKTRGSSTEYQMSFKNFPKDISDENELEIAI